MNKSSVNDESDVREKRRKVEESSAADESLFDQINLIEKCESGLNLIDFFESLWGQWEPDVYVYDPYEWEVSIFEDV
jgi:hypothetical protein